MESRTEMSRLGPDKERGKISRDSARDLRLEKRADFPTAPRTLTHKNNQNRTILTSGDPDRTEKKERERAQEQAGIT